MFVIIMAKEISRNHKKHNVIAFWDKMGILLRKMSRKLSSYF